MAVLVDGMMKRSWQFSFIPAGRSSLLHCIPSQPNSLPQKNLTNIITIDWFKHEHKISPILSLLSITNPPIPTPTNSQRTLVRITIPTRLTPTVSRRRSVPSTFLPREWNPSSSETRDSPRNTTRVAERLSNKLKEAKYYMLLMSIKWYLLF